VKLNESADLESGEVLQRFRHRAPNGFDNNARRVNDARDATVLLGGAIFVMTGTGRKPALKS
jgi:hypothetical protein